MACYRNSVTGGCGPYEMLSCSDCPASKPAYAERKFANEKAQDLYDKLAAFHARIDQIKENRELGSQEFLDRCRVCVANYFNEKANATDKNGGINPNLDVYVVWYCKTLQNHKALLSTTVPDGMYYEFTYNGDKKECYMDAYKKWENKIAWA